MPVIQEESLCMNGMTLRYTPLLLIAMFLKVYLLPINVSFS